MIIKSSKKLCSNYDAFSRLAHQTGEPIYITKDGEGDLVLLSLEAYEQLVGFTSKSENLLIADREDKCAMTEFKLGSILKEMYQTAPKGQQVANIHLFGIHYANIINKERLNKKEILRSAGLPESYQPEISKGINLASYVDVKPDQIIRIKEIQDSIGL